MQVWPQLMSDSGCRGDASAAGPGAIPWDRVFSLKDPTMWVNTHSCTPKLVCDPKEGYGIRVLGPKCRKHEKAMGR